MIKKLLVPIEMFFIFCGIVFVIAMIVIIHDYRSDFTPKGCIYSYDGKFAMYELNNDDGNIHTVVITKPTQARVYEFIPTFRLSKSIIFGWMGGEAYDCYMTDREGVYLFRYSLSSGLWNEYYLFEDSVSKEYYTVGIAPFGDALKFHDRYQKYNSSMIPEEILPFIREWDIPEAVN